MATNKRSKMAEARKKAEAVKARRKAVRSSKASASIQNKKPGQKGKSLIAQSKKRK